MPARADGLRRCAAAALLLAAVALVAAGGGEGTEKHALAPQSGPLVALALDEANATELFPNQSVSGSVGPQAPRLFKVFANRSLAAPELLTVTLEASGGSFPVGGLSLFDPQQMLVDELSTRNGGEIVVSNVIVPQTGFYLLVIQSNQLYYWSVTVNHTLGGPSPSDNDNDLANATVLSGGGGAVNDSVADWSDLFDTFAIDLASGGASADALLLNLTSPGTADIDLYIYHLEGGYAVVDSLSITPTGTEFAAAAANATRTYYVRVLSYAGSSAYTLTWARLNVSADDNGDASKATALVGGPRAGALARWDLRDFFRLDLVANTTVNITFATPAWNATTREPDLQAVLWTESLARVTWSFDFDPYERINATVPVSGAYLLEVFAGDASYFLTQNLSFDYAMDVVLDPPPRLLPADWNLTLAEDARGTVDLLQVIPRDPAGEPLAFSVGGVLGNLTATLSGDGHTLVIVPAADWSGAGWISVRAADRWRAETLALPVLVTAVNDPPRLAAGFSSLAFDEDTAFDFLYAAALFDPEGDAFQVLSASPAAPLAGTAVNGGLRLAAPADAHGAFVLQIEVEDAAGAAANLSVPVAVRAVNDAPRFVRAPLPFALLEDAPASNATFSLAGFAVDPDGDPVRYTVDPLGPVTALVNGEELAVYPDPNFAGDVPGTLRATDGAASAALGILIRVTAVNDPPRLQLPAGQQVGREGEPLALSIDAEDADTPLADLRYSFFLDGVALVTNASSRTITVPFSFNDSGFHVLRATVTDGGGTDAADLAVFVAEVNRPPVAQVLSPRGATFRVGEVVAFTARAEDPDGGPLNVTWLLDGSLASNSPSFSREGLRAGRHTVELLVSDGQVTSRDATSFEVAQATPGLDPAALVLVLAASALLAARRPRSRDRANNDPKRLK